MVTKGVCYFVDSDGRDAIHATVDKSVFHHPVDAAEHGVP